jgi:hypothetical protein
MQRIVKIRINSILGNEPARIVRDMSADAWARTCANALPDEAVYEVQWIARKGYAFVPARDIRK